MANDEHLLGRSSYRETNIDIIEAESEQATIMIVSHWPFSNDYTCTIPSRHVAHMLANNTYAPFLMMINSMVQLMINSDLDSNAK